MDRRPVTMESDVGSMSSGTHIIVIISYIWCQMERCHHLDFLCFTLVSDVGSMSSGTHIIVIISYIWCQMWSDVIIWTSYVLHWCQMWEARHLSFLYVTLIGGR